MDEELTADLPLWDDEQAYSLLCELCAKHQVLVDSFRELVAIERRHQHRVKARGIYDEFDAVFERMG
ncbi:MAG: hypothetical protein Q8O37_14335 [Sulfuricellaceae bacterium]|nr:hypothetical protein [Sulfuricellaceae bacterium]